MVIFQGCTINKCVPCNLSFEQYLFASVLLKLGNDKGKNASNNFHYIYFSEALYVTINELHMVLYVDIHFKYLPEGKLPCSFTKAIKCW